METIIKKTELVIVDYIDPKGRIEITARDNVSIILTPNDGESHLDCATQFINSKGYKVIATAETGERDMTILVVESNSKLKL